MNEISQRCSWYVLVRSSDVSDEQDLSPIGHVVTIAPSSLRRSSPAVTLISVLLT